MKAKEEMMQGIQIVKEMAQQELSSQKAAYESKIKVLEAELVRGRTVSFLCRCRAPGERQRGDHGCWAGGGEADRLCPPALGQPCLPEAHLEGSALKGLTSDGYFRLG